MGGLKFLPCMKDANVSPFTAAQELLDGSSSRLKLGEQMDLVFQATLSPSSSALRYPRFLLDAPVLSCRLLTNIPHPINRSRIAGPDDLPCPAPSDQRHIRLQDMDLVPLLIQENYLNHRPQIAGQSLLRPPPPTLNSSPPSTLIP